MRVRKIVMGLGAGGAALIATVFLTRQASRSAGSSELSALAPASHAVAESSPNWNSDPAFSTDELTPARGDKSSNVSRTGAEGGAHFESRGPMSGRSFAARETSEVSESSAVEQLFRRFSAEEREPVWSASTEGEVYERIAGLRQSVLLTSVECRSTLCRAEIVLPGDPREAKGQDISLIAMVYGNTLAKRVADEIGLGLAMFNSGYTESGMPTIVMFFEGNRSD